MNGVTHQEAATRDGSTTCQRGFVLSIVERLVATRQLGTTATRSGKKHETLAASSVRNNETWTSMNYKKRSGNK